MQQEMKEKLREIKNIMADLPVEVVSMKEAGIEAEIEETGATFEENAKIKAQAVAAYTDDIVLADDSGLEIDYLNKEPGVYSARYLGENTSYGSRTRRFLTVLPAFKKRSGQHALSARLQQFFRVRKR